MSGGLGDEEEEDGLIVLLYGLLGLAFIVCMFSLTFSCCMPCLNWCCRRCCGCCCCCCAPLGRRLGLSRAGGAAGGGGADGAATAVLVGGEELPVEHLKKRKESTTAMALWLFGGLFGAHHFYLDRLAHGLLCLWTLNFFVVGWFADSWLLPWYIYLANRGTHEASQQDGSTRRVMTRIPFAGFAAACAAMLLIVAVPPVLQDSGAVDLERLAAKTAQNPYEILGVPRGASQSAVKAAFQEKTARAESSPRCDKKCMARVKEVKQAYDFVSGKAWRRSPKSKAQPRGAARARTRAGDGAAAGGAGAAGAGTGDRTWKDWSDYTIFEWQAIGAEVKTRAEAFADSFKSQEDDAAPPRPGRPGGGEM